MNRKQRRKAAKVQDQNLSEKISLFQQIPDACTACGEPFDKKDKDMAFSWRVVVHEAKQQVRLFCPECIIKTKEALNNVSKTHQQ